MKYLLDTDHISILQRQSVTEYTMLIAQISKHSLENLAFSIISFHEQVMGCHTYINRARTTGDTVRGYNMLGRVLKNFAVVPVIEFDATAAEVFDSLLARRVRVGTMDLRIASIAPSRNMILVTRNVNEFNKIPGLQVEDWTIQKVDC